MADLKSRPICDRCNKPVERMTEDYDYFCRRLVLVAECHGERERVDIGDEVLASGRFSLSFGRAFVQPKTLTAGRADR